MQCEKVNMDNYRFYLPTRIWSFESSKQDLTGEVLYFPGPSISPRDRDLDGCTSCDGDSDDDATFSFHTYLVFGLDFGVVDSLFSTCPSSFFWS